MWEYSTLLYLVIILAFLVKIPIFLVHLWLPKAHVEAPVRGSMILAGVLLKLGGYGLFRVLGSLAHKNLCYRYIWVGVRLVGGVIVRFICLRQSDLKSLVAYSSVAHIGLVLGGLITINYWGTCGAYTIIIAHGLCSSGLFCLTNITYERLGSRRLLINKGLINLIPRLSLWWFLLRASNIAAPPTLNLLGEISLLNSLVGWSWVTIRALMLVSFFSAAYTLFLYAYSQHGKLNHRGYSSIGGYVREYVILMLHWLPLNILILKSEPSLLWL
jgi:NADH-ubiquinone oxidoreductase chain 4